MTTETKDQDKLSVTIVQLEKIARDAGPYNQEVFSLLADCRNGLVRAGRRAATLPDEFERIEFKQTRGPTVEATARLLCENSHNGRDGNHYEMEIWETQGGALIAMSSSAPIDGGGFEDLRVTVVEPVIIDKYSPECHRDRVELERRFAVMDHFNWDLRARSMVVKKLKWSLRCEVD